QCIDIPFDIGLAKVSQTTEQLDRALAAVETDAIIAVLPPVCFEYDLAPGESLTTSYFSPLRTIILLA
ncbi:MAG: hypothetical protein JSW47_17970, partial [Phycisphaerales bacterium]